MDALTRMINEDHLNLTQALHTLYLADKKDIADEAIQSRYDTWASTARAINERIGMRYPEAQEPMLPLPPKDEEHQPCRAMWAATMQRIITNDDVGFHILPFAMDYMASTKSWYEHENCACRTTGWKNRMNKETLTIFYTNAARAQKKNMTINEYKAWQASIEAVAAAAAQSLADEKAAKKIVKA